MSLDKISIPEGLGTCTMVARAEAGFLQKVTIDDRYLGTTYGPWIGGGQGGTHVELGRHTVLPDVNPTGHGYPVEVHIESSGDGGITWGESRSKIVQLQTPNPQGCLFVVGSEDIGSGDGDYNDAYVMFTWISLIGLPFEGPSQLVEQFGMEKPSLQFAEPALKKTMAER